MRKRRLIVIVLNKFKGPYISADWPCVCDGPWVFFFFSFFQIAAQLQHLTLDGGQVLFPDLQ